MSELLWFMVLSLPLIYLSWRSLFKLKKHGLYRFITWECVLWIAIQNYHYEAGGNMDLRLSVASVLTMSSLVIVIAALITMRRHGQASKQRHDETLFAFEKTTELVTNGLFRYIRHPMYASLLCLIWGLFFRQPQSFLLVIALIGTLSCCLAALIEEQENLDFFGEKYQQYMQQTKRFIPFVF